MTTTNREFENDVENDLQPGVAFNHLAEILDRQYGSLTIDFDADAGLTLTQVQCDYGVLVFTDSGTVLTGPVDVEFTAAFPPKLVTNSTAQDLTLKRTGTTGVVVSAGDTALIGCGPTDVVALAGGGSDVLNVASPTNVSGTVTLNFAGKSRYVGAITLGANVTTLAFSNLPGAGKYAEYELHIKQDPATPRTFALPASHKALGGSDTAIAAGVGVTTVLTASTVDNGTTWRYAMQESA